MATDRLVEADVSPRFSLGSDTPDIALELTNEWAGPDYGPFTRTVREFPVLNGVLRRASVGTINNTGIVRQLTRNEFIQFNGSDSASLEYPPDTNFTIQTEFVFGFSEEGRVLTPGQVSFRFTRFKRDFTANRPFYGAVRVRYIAPYRVLAYEPQIGVEDAVNTLDDAYFRRFGAIISYKDQAVATLDIPPNDLGDFALYKELYRVVSVVQSNENGPWELHPNFDSGGQWNEDAPADGGSYMSYERPHEIGYLVRGTTGRVEFETSSVIIEQGPPTPTSFKPALSVRFHAASSFEGTEWEDAYRRLGDAGIERAKADIRKRWGDVSFDD